MTSGTRGETVIPDKPSDNLVPFSPRASAAGDKPRRRRGGGPPDDGGAPPPSPARADCPVVPLGLDAKTCWLLSAARMVVPLTPRDMSRAGLEMAFAGDLSWPFANFANADDGKLVLSDLRTWIMRECRAAGHFALADQARGAGIWLDGPEDNRRIVIHCGDRVGVWRGAGGISWHDPGVLPELSDCKPLRVYYPDAALPPPAARACDPVEVEALLEDLKTWGWAQPDRDSRAMLGWISAALVIGLLPFRPSVWLTAGSGAGKSTLQSLVGKIVGPWLARAAEPTPAGVRQAISGAVRPVAVDEIEPDGISKTAERVAQLVRVASGNDQAPILRGTPEGRAQEFTVRAGFFFSSILVPPLAPQDRNRIAVLTLSGPPDTGSGLAAMMDRAAAIGPSLRRRLLERWDDWPAVFAAFRAALADGGHRARTQDLIGTLLSCAWLSLERGVPPPSEAAVWAAQWADDTEADGDADAAGCLAVLTESLLQDHGGVPLTLGRKIAVVARENDGQAAADLRAYGLRVEFYDSGGGPTRYLLVSRSAAAGLGKVFSGTPWAGGGWAQSLERLPGAVTDRKQWRFSPGSAPQRAVYVPLALIVEPDAGGPVTEDTEL